MIILFEPQVQNVFSHIFTKGDIYLGTYCGYYNPREECFITETEAKKTDDYIDPISKKKYEIISESSYFFKMELYRSRLISHIQNTPQFIPDINRRNKILNRLKEHLDDLSITRTSFEWGIPIPKIEGEETKESHILYVWLDALCNYKSGEISSNLTAWGKYGPPIHIIGQDILWFHAVIWSCIFFRS